MALAQQRWVSDRPDRTARGVHQTGDVVKFHWEAVADDSSTATVGLNVLVLAADGRVQRNDTFVDFA